MSSLAGPGKGSFALCQPINVSGEMVHQVIHNATVTLQLSFYLSVDERVEALRAAGIPVDESGNATAGYLFVRTTGRVGKRRNTYRWFAAGIGEEAHAGDVLPESAWAEEKFAHAGETDIGAAPIAPAAPELVPATVAYLRLWKELEQRSRDAASAFQRQGGRMSLRFFEASFRRPLPRAAAALASGSAIRTDGRIRACCGCSSMAERQLPKLHTRVRFPSPAPQAPHPCAACTPLTAAAQASTGSPPSASC